MQTIHIEQVITFRRCGVLWFNTIQRPTVCVVQQSSEELCGTNKHYQIYYTIINRSSKHIVLNLSKKLKGTNIKKQ